jgi:chromosome segregation ATPase
MEILMNQWSALQQQLEPLVQLLPDSSDTPVDQSHHQLFSSFFRDDDPEGSSVALFVPKILRHIAQNMVRLENEHEAFIEHLASVSPEDARVQSLQSLHSSNKVLKTKFDTLQAQIQQCEEEAVVAGQELATANSKIQELDRKLFETNRELASVERQLGSDLDSKQAEADIIDIHDEEEWRLLADNRGTQLTELQAKNAGLSEQINKMTSQPSQKSITESRFYKFLALQTNKLKQDIATLTKKK